MNCNKRFYGLGLEVEQAPGDVDSSSPIPQNEMRYMAKENQHIWGR